MEAVNTDASADDQQLISIYQVYKSEAEQGRYSRIQQNKLNFDCFHLRQDFSYKTKGQSKEFLPKLKMAVEQSALFMQQGLVDMDDWYRVYPAPGISEDLMKIKPSWIYELLSRQLKKTDFVQFVGDSCKLGFLASLMIAKVGGQYKSKPKYKVRKRTVNGKVEKKLVRMKDKRWELQVSLVQPEDFRIDPTGKNLYKMQDIYMDYYQVEQMAKGPDAIYDLSVVKRIKGDGGYTTPIRESTKARETNQNVAMNGYRRQVKVTEIWGNFVNAEGELLWENCVATIANDKWVIQQPTANPMWHDEDPFVICPIFTVPGSVWGSALADAPAAINMAQNEMFNLMLDGGLMSVHGIKQIREDWLEDPSQIEDGIGAGDTLRVNSACPPGVSVLERVDTSSVPQDGIQVYNLLNEEFTTAAMTNDLRMGAEPFRQVKATAIVESSQALTSMFSGLAEHVEQHYIRKILSKSWMTCAQHMNDLDEDEIAAVVGDVAQKTLLQMGPEELFADTIQGLQFEVFGISSQLEKQKDFTKLTALLQTVSASPPLMEEFVKKYDLGKYLGEIIKASGVNPSKIQADDYRDQKNGMQPPQGTPQPGQQQGELPNAQSQIPQAGAAGNQGDLKMSAIPQPNFPASRATPKAG